MLNKLCRVKLEATVIMSHWCSAELLLLESGLDAALPYWRAWTSSFCFVGCIVESGISLISCPLWSCLVYLLVKFIKHNQNYYLKLDVSTSIRALHRKKLVLSSSGSWYDGKTPCQESGRMHSSALITVHGLLSFLSGCVWPLIHLMEASDRGRNVKF